jgi:hypothetical protein
MALSVRTSFALGRKRCTTSLVDSSRLNSAMVPSIGDDIPADCTIGVSTVSTCASGLTERAGIPFVSLASLLEQVSRP